MNTPKNQSQSKTERTPAPWNREKFFDELNTKLKSFFGEGILLSDYLEEDWNECGWLRVQMFPGGRTLLKVSKPSDKVTVDWVVDRVRSKLLSEEKNKERLNKRREYIDSLKNQLRKKSEWRGDVYATTFGFSVDNLFKSDDEVKKIAESVASQLGLKIKRFTYSDALWVLQVHVSQTLTVVN